MAKRARWPPKVFRVVRRRRARRTAEATRTAGRALRNIDFQSVRPASKAFGAESGTTDKISYGRTGRMPMFRQKICERRVHRELFLVGSKVAEKKCLTAVAAATCIEIRGARQNNLKGVDLDLPLGKLTVVTGPSGSGKSSLAFETIYAEGQRRYVETFSPYMRQFLDRMDKPRVDDIRGIPPAIAIEQANPVKSSRSTVGTMTEINDYLKLLWPRIAKAFCPSCGREIRPETAKSIADEVLHDCAGKNVLITFWVAVPAKTEPRKFFEFLQQQGYLRVWIDNEVVRVDVDPKKIKRLGARVQVIQDRIAITQENRARLVEALETALRFGKGKVNVVVVEAAVSAATTKKAAGTAATTVSEIRNPQ